MNEIESLSDNLTKSFNPINACRSNSECAININENTKSSAFNSRSSSLNSNNLVDDDNDADDDDDNDEDENHIIVSKKRSSSANKEKLINEMDEENFNSTIFQIEAANKVAIFVFKS